MNKVIIIAPAYYPSAGGVENHIRAVVAELKKMAWQPLILVRYSRFMPKKQRIDDIDVLRLPKRDGKVFMAIWYFLHRKMFSNTTVIHSHDYYPRTLRNLLPHDQKWVHTFHGYEGYPLDPIAIKSRQQVRSEVSWCACVGGFIEKWYGTKCDYITYGAVNKEKFIKKEKNETKWDYIFYGRLEDDTGFEQYLKGFNIISQKQPTSSMLVIGDGEKMAWAKRYVSDNRLNVMFVGKKPHSDIAKYIHLARVIFVSGYLGFLEAMLSRKPIIAFYNNPLKKDYLSMHPMADTMSIISDSNAIAKAAAVPVDSKKINKAYNWALQQSWDKIAQAYSKAYSRK